MTEQTVFARLCQFSRAASLQQMCEMIYEILGNPVFIKDMAHTTLAYTRSVEIDDERWQRAVVRSELERGTFNQSREVGSLHETSAEAQMPLLVTDGPVTTPRIIKALSHGGKVVAVMVVTSYLRPFGPDDISILELVSHFVTEQVIRERDLLRNGDRPFESFLFSLLDGPVPEKEQVKRRLELLGYRPAPSCYVLAICPEEGQDQRMGDSINDLLEELSAIPRCHVVLYNAVLVCLYEQEGDISRWEQEAPALTALLEKWDMTMGVSRRFSALEELKAHYAQAAAALDVGRRLRRGSRYQTYDEASSFLMFRALPQEKLDTYCNQKIRELSEYDRQHNTELCVTLQVYLEQTKSLVRTADILFVHRNTVRYRINKCMELLGTDLEDGNEIFSYILSLRLLEYRKKYEEKTVEGR